MERPARAHGSRGAGHGREGVPICKRPDRDRLRQRHDRRRELHAICRGRRAAQVRAAPPADVEHTARQREAIEERTPDLRRRSTGGLLLARDPHGGRPPRRRAQCTRSCLSRPRLLPADRARVRLRLERDLCELRRDRPVRGDALRKRHDAVPLQGAVPRHGQLRRRHAQGPGRRAGHGADLSHDSARPRSSATPRPAARRSRSLSTARLAGASCSARSRSRPCRRAVCTTRSSSSTR